MSARAERLSVFRSLLGSISPVYLTEYNASCEILETNAPQQEIFRNFFFLDRVEIAEEGTLPLPEGGVTGPAMFTNSLGMTFLTD